MIEKDVLFPRPITSKFFKIHVKTGGLEVDVKIDIIGENVDEVYYKDEHYESKTETRRMTVKLCHVDYTTRCSLLFQCTR